MIADIITTEGPAILESLDMDFTLGSVQPMPSVNAYVAKLFTRQDSPCAVPMIWTVKDDEEHQTDEQSRAFAHQLLTNGVKTMRSMLDQYNQLPANEKQAMTERRHTDAPFVSPIQVLETDSDGRIIDPGFPGV